MRKVGSVVERGLATVVEGDLVLKEDVDDDALSIVAGHVQRSTAIGIDGIRLQGEMVRQWKVWFRRSLIVLFCIINTVLKFDKHVGMGYMNNT